MLRGILAGAGLVTLLDLACRIPLLAPGFWRETALLSSSGALLIALILASLLVALRRALGRPPLDAGVAFWYGAGIALVPLVGSLLPVRTLGVGAAALSFALARPLSRALRLPSTALWLLAAVPFLVPPALLLLPGTPLPELPAASRGPAASGPDVLLVSCDTLRADSLEELGDELPHLSALRDRGRWAPYGLAPSSATRPSHVTMLSGLPAVAHGVRNNDLKMGPEVRLVSERFRQAGWRTAAVISNPMISASARFDAGFEVFDETPIVRRLLRDAELSQGPFSLGRFLVAAERGTWIGWLGLYRPPLEDLLLHRWKGLPRNQGNGSVSLARARVLMTELQAQEAPYFLFLHLMDPHTPYEPPAAQAHRPGRAVRVPPAFGGGPAVLDWKLLERVGEGLVAGEAGAEQFLEQVRQVYLEEVLFVDSLMGELLAQVERGGRETVVLFTSDHGEHFGEHDLVMHSNSLYEPVLRVPFLLAGPGIEPGRFGAPPHLVDVAPTLLAAAGLPTEGLSGRDLSRGAVADRPQVSRFQDLLAVRRGSWKLILRQDEEGGFQPTGLFRLDLDPAEADDLLGQHPPQAAELLELAAAAAALERDLAGGAELDTDRAHQAALDELGYAGSLEPESER